MAIIIRKKSQKVYVSASGVVVNSEKQKADKLDSELGKALKDLEKALVKDKYLTKKGVKKDALRVWYEIGKLLNRIVRKYKIKDSEDEPIFWQAVYDHVSSRIQKKPPPKRSSDWKRNHFRLCAKMAERKWREVTKVGNWSVWRDLFDNAKLLEDERVFDWVVRAIRQSGLGHKELRSFIHATRRRLKKIDMSVLSDRELSAKLKDVAAESTGKS